MTQFFILTEQAVAVGPFSGIELREAAMAGIIGPEAAVGGSAEGPWHHASNAGLFSGKNLPTPHPPGTHVPTFKVRGMAGAMQGPFKLRELIGFASRGMLPGDAMVKSNISEKWVSVSRINILQACLAGHLVLIGKDGEVLLRAHQTHVGKAPTQTPATARAPIAVSRSVDTTDVTAFAVEVDEPDEDFIEEQASQKSKALADAESDERQPRRWRGRIDSATEGVRMPRLAALSKFNISWRMLVSSAAVILVVASIGTAYSHWQKAGLMPEHVYGQWVSADGSAGIALRENGNLVAFDTRNPSWSGDFIWAPRTDDDQGFASIEPFSSQVDTVDQGHQLAAVQPSDGYVQLRGFKTASIGNHAMSDCFLRVDGSTLRVGYLASVHWNHQNKSMEAGWIAFNRRENTDQDLLSELTSMEKEPPPQVGFAVEQAPHISEAIEPLLEAYESGGSIAQRVSQTRGSACYCVRIDAAYLLQKFGVPDEAREVYRFEKSALPDTLNLEGSQVVRYGAVKLVLSDKGKIQYVSVADA